MGENTLKVGDRFRYVGENDLGVTSGNVYTISQVLSGDEFMFKDDDGDTRDWSLVGFPVEILCEESSGEGMTTYDTGAVRETKVGKGKQHYLFVGFPHTLTELSKHMDNPLGRNWEEGLPVSCYADGAIRHLLGFLAGDQEPHHLRAAIWNMMCLSETVHRVEVGQLPDGLDDVDRSKRSEIVYGVD